MLWRAELEIYVARGVLAGMIGRRYLRTCPNIRKFRFGEIPDIWQEGERSDRLDEVGVHRP